MIVAVLGTEGDKSLNDLYVDGNRIATIWGEPKAEQPDDKGNIMVSFHSGLRLLGFWHVQRTFYQPATPAALVMMGIVL